MTVATSLRLDKTFKASVFVDGRKLTCYAPKSSRVSASCYVASQVNKAFAVEFDRGEFDRHKLEIVLSIDGHEVDSQLQCPENEDHDTRTRFEDVETNSGTKEFRFSAITGDMVDGDTQSEAESSEILPAAIGTIELAIYRAINARKMSEARAAKQKDPLDRLVLPAIPRTELSSAYHRVVLADKDNSSPESDHESCSSDCDSLTSECGSRDWTFDRKERLATFTFNYRPLAVLQSVSVVDPRKKSNTPVSTASNTAQAPSTRLRRTGTSSSSIQRTSVAGPSSTPPQRATQTTTGSSARVSRTGLPVASTNKLQQRDTQPVHPTRSTSSSRAKSTCIPSTSSAYSAAATSAATSSSTTQSSSTTHAPAGPSANSSSRTPASIERSTPAFIEGSSSRSLQHTAQHVFAQPALKSALRAEQAEQRSRNASSTSAPFGPRTLSSSYLVAHSYTPERTGDVVGLTDPGRPGRRQGIPKQAVPTTIQTGTPSADTEVGTSAPNNQGRAERTSSRGGDILPEPSMPEKTAVLPRVSGHPPQNPVQTINTTAQQRPARPIDQQIDAKRELDIVVKPEPSEDVQLPVDQDNGSASADEDKQDKWDLERLMELHNRKRKRKQDRKARSGQTFLDDEEDDDTDDQISSLIKRLKQSNKRRRMRTQNPEIIDLSWM